MLFWCQVKLDYEFLTYIMHYCRRSKEGRALVDTQGAKERLRLFKADLEDENSFDSAINGCEGVFHVASPCISSIDDPQADLIDPAVKGTVNVVECCAKSPTVKRVVLTSSRAAVIHNGRPLTPEVVVDETWFSDADYCRKAKMWYPLSKTLAEEAAWRLAKEKGIDLVVMNHAVVIGPLLQPTLNASCAAIFNLIGAKTYPGRSCGWVHVKDVANAHILAFETQSANGRYCLVESVVHSFEIVNILRELYPTLQLPDKCADDNPPMPTWKVSQDKARSLGINFIPLELCLRDTIQSFKDKKFLSTLI